MRLRIRRKAQHDDVSDPLPTGRYEVVPEFRVAESASQDVVRIFRRRSDDQLHDRFNAGAKWFEREPRFTTKGDQDLVPALCDPDGSIDEAERPQSSQERVRLYGPDNSDAHPFEHRSSHLSSLPRYLYESLLASPRIMRAPALVLALLLVGLAFVHYASAEDFGAVGKVNKLISIVSTPELAPGENGRFEFELNVTYTEPIIDVTLNVSIYRYATIEESIPVDASWPYAYPFIEGNGTREQRWTWAQIDPNTMTSVSFTIVTAADSHQMPHGSVFSQASYFVRFYLTFTGNLSGTPEQFVMASRGYFSEAQWDEAISDARTDPCNPPSCRGNVNLTVLGVDGILPDSAFGVKEPIPRWPFYLLIALAVVFLVLAFLFWVEENPDSYPRIEAWWARSRGRLARTFAPMRRKKPPNT